MVSFTAVAATAEEPRSLAFSAGAFNFTKDETQAEVGLEYRAPIGRWGLVGAFGLYGTEESSLWVFGGLRRDISLSRHWLLTPAFAVALYEQGDGKDLGGTLQFRSALEIGYLWANRSRLALAFYHLSNAGLDDLNPGSNSLILSYSLPLE